MRNQLKDRTKSFAPDEAQFWLELIVEHGLLPAERASSLHDEAGQLVAIAVTSIKTARGARPSIPHSALNIPQSF